MRGEYIDDRQINDTLSIMNGNQVPTDARFPGLRNGFILLMVALMSAGLLGSCASPPPTNVVLIIVDDLGWMDTGVYGSSFYETPNMDRLVESGMRFTQFYAANPVCSPTRASIMAGKDPARLRITNWIGGEQKGRLLQAEYRRQLPLEEETIAERFRAAGYATGYIGKWHLGGEGFFPEDQGFDTNIGGHGAGQPGSYFYPYENPRNERANVPGLEDGRDGEYLTDRLTDESIEFLSEHPDDPFFLVLAHYAVHTPLESKQEWIEYYEDKKVRNRPCGEEVFTSQIGRGMTRRCQDHSVYAGMVASTDESIGRLTASLDSLGLTDRTAVVFVSDNGGLSTLARGTRAPTANDPLRAGKGWLYEGGIRIPFAVVWPGFTEPGTVSRLPATTTDIYATLLQIAGLPAREDDPGDGISLVPVLTGGAIPAERPLFWHFPHYHGSGNRPSGAVRVGRFKLVEWFEDGSVELYDLEDDPSETIDLSEVNREITDRMKDQLHEWRDSIGAAMPVPNPDWAGQ